MLEKVKEEKIKVNFGSRALPLVLEDQPNIYILCKGKKIEKDLIVVADGVGSTWKKNIFRDIKARTISQSAYRFVLRKKTCQLFFLKMILIYFKGISEEF